MDATEQAVDRPLMPGEKITPQDLTILSVNFKGRFFLELNYACTSYLNNTSIKWIVVENSPDSAEGRIEAGNSNFQIIQGVPPPDITGRIHGAYHHGSALNKGIQHIKTRFALVLDPDFFIVRKHWADEILSFIVQNNLDFFGVPWHPRHWRKYRYFPSVHSLFIDLEKIKPESLDFSPDLINNPTNDFNPGFWLGYQKLRSEQRWLRSCYLLFRQPFRALNEDLAQRTFIGSSRDTGYFLNLKFGRSSNFKYFTVQPVFRPGKDGFLPPSVSGLQSSGLVESLFPDIKRYIPGRRDYYSIQGFKDLGFNDLITNGWEEFVWNNKPYGFHVRGYALKDPVKETGNDSLILALNNLTGFNYVKYKNGLHK